jgi:hypothetical protein
MLLKGGTGWLLPHCRDQFPPKQITQHLAPACRLYLADKLFCPQVCQHLRFVWIGGYAEYRDSPHLLWLIGNPK